MGGVEELALRHGLFGDVTYEKPRPKGVGVGVRRERGVAGPFGDVTMQGVVLGTHCMESLSRRMYIRV